MHRYCASHGERTDPSRAAPGPAGPPAGARAGPPAADAPGRRAAGERAGHRHPARRAARHQHRRDQLPPASARRGGHGGRGPGAGHRAAAVLAGRARRHPVGGQRLRRRPGRPRRHRVDRGRTTSASSPSTPNGGAAQRHEWSPAWRDAFGMGDFFMRIPAARLEAIKAEVFAVLERHRDETDPADPRRRDGAALPRRVPRSARSCRPPRRSREHPVRTPGPVPLPHALRSALAAQRPADDRDDPADAGARAVAVPDRPGRPPRRGLVVLALELPTGGFADALGRRPVLLVALGGRPGLPGADGGGRLVLDVLPGLGVAGRLPGARQRPAGILVRRRHAGSRPRTPSTNAASAGPAPSSASPSAPARAARRRAGRARPARAGQRVDRAGAGRRRAPGRLDRGVADADAGAAPHVGPGHGAGLGGAGAPDGRSGRRPAAPQPGAAGPGLRRAVLGLRHGHVRVAAADPAVRGGRWRRPGGGAARPRRLGRLAGQRGRRRAHPGPAASPRRRAGRPRCCGCSRAGPWSAWACSPARSAC